MKAPPEGAAEARASVVTPGNHDGAHLGHRSLVEHARSRADALGARAVVLTFDPHPLAVIAPDRAPPILTTLERRRSLLRAMGADEVVVQPFDRAFASLRPEAFARTILAERLRARELVVGPDFRFGQGREGDHRTLARLGEALGFAVSRCEVVELDGGPISSTRIREALGEGEVEAASRLLGRAHEVSGEVVRGDQRGRTIGFPTANLRPEPVLLPRDGVYAVVCRVLREGEGRGGEGEAELLRGVANLGLRPTFDAGRSAEVHLLDFEGDLYGATLRVAFLRRLRGEQRFDGLEALVAQIGRDVEAGRAAIEAADPTLWAYL